MPEVDEIVAAVLRKAMGLKEELVATEGVGVDLPLAIELRRLGVNLGVALPGELTGLIRTIRGLVALTACDHVILLGEVFAYHADHPPGRHPDPGDLARWFAAGHPGIRECLQVVSAYAEGRVDAGQIDYRYDGRRMVWGEMWASGLELAGTIPVVLLDGFALQRTRPGPAFPPTVVARGLGVEFLAPTLTGDPACPCGSGIKAKHCCRR